ncbi:hypothetical protein CHS0354_015573 [Potamilus streckersoni]|uniref:Uncharacterized protein n=1 Tax=Potamilus streckersoni TaxID=2493646 RepID=A0AAE0SVZ1_9BIVA|nr:hypothetical protein CHS0354_015573 [Potamilus streckersoni]
MENEWKHLLLILHLLFFISCTSCVAKEITEEAVSAKTSSAIEKRSLDKFGFVDDIGQEKEAKTVQRETGSTKEDYDSQLAHKLSNIDAAKRRMDRFAFAGTLGKRLDELEQVDEGDVEKRKMDRLSFLSNLGKRSKMDFSYLDNLGKRGRLDRYMFTGNLGKRGRMDRYSFIGNLGKRRGRMDRYSFIGNLGKRPSMDRYSFIGTLGKRGEDLFPFAESLETRQGIDAYPLAESLGRNVAKDNADSDDTSVDDGDSEFGKRGRLDMKSLYGQLGKRSKRSLFFPRNDVRYTRNNKPMRGIDKYSFAARLGKREPDYRFLPTLGKRTYLALEDDGLNSAEIYSQ